MAKFALLFHWLTLVYSGMVIFAVEYDEWGDLFDGRNVDLWFLMSLWLFVGSLLVSGFLAEGVFKPKPAKNSEGLFSLLKLTVKRKIQEEKKRLKSLDS